MQLFIDTAEIRQIRIAQSWGTIDGVTTNPSHIAATGRNFDEVLAEIFEAVDGPVSVETVSPTVGAIVREGRAIAALHRNAVVKVPVTVEGLKAVKRLAGEGIRTNATACFSVLQTHLAAKSGATYVSPFVHRTQLAGGDGIALLRDIRTVYDRYGYDTKILAASIRSAKQVLDSLLAGADVVTAPLDILESLYSHSLTDAVLAKFNADWQSVPPTRLFSVENLARYER
jgi:transaldolase